MKLPIRIKNLCLPLLICMLVLITLTHTVIRAAQTIPGAQRLEEGIVAYEHGEYDDAIFKLEMAVYQISEEKNDQLWNAYFYLGLSYFLSGEEEEGIKGFHKAKDISKNRLPDPDIHSSKIIKLFEESNSEIGSVQDRINVYEGEIKQKFRLLSYIKDQDNQKVISVKIGQNYKIPDSKYSITIKDYYPDAEYLQEPVNISNEPDNPSICVQLFDAGNIIAEGWLLAKDRNFYNNSERNLKIEYLWADNDEDYERLAKTVGKSAEPKLDIVIERNNLHKSILVKEGKRISIDGTDYVLEIKEFALDYSKRLAPLSDQELNNPAVRVEITGPRGTDSRWTFSKYPDYWDKAHQTKYKDVKLSFSVPDDFIDAPHRVKIVQSEDGKKTISYLKENILISIKSWEISNYYDIGEGLQVRIMKYFPSHSLRKEVVKRSDTIENPALLIEIQGPSGNEECWLFSQKPPKWYSDKNFSLLFEKIKQ
jgi:hypothetical protein